MAPKKKSEEELLQEKLKQLESQYKDSLFSEKPLPEKIQEDITASKPEKANIPEKAKPPVSRDISKKPAEPERISLGGMDDLSVPSLNELQSLDKTIPSEVVKEEESTPKAPLPAIEQSRDPEEYKKKKRLFSIKHTKKKKSSETHKKSKRKLLKRFSKEKVHAPEPKKIEKSYDEMPGITDNPEHLQKIINILTKAEEKRLKELLTTPLQTLRKKLSFKDYLEAARLHKDPGKVFDERKEERFLSDRALYDKKLLETPLDKLVKLVPEKDYEYAFALHKGLVKPAKEKPKKSPEDKTKSEIIIKNAEIQFPPMTTGVPLPARASSKKGAQSVNAGTETKAQGSATSVSGGVPSELSLSGGNLEVTATIKKPPVNPTSETPEKVELTIPFAKRPTEKDILMCAEHIQNIKKEMSKTLVGQEKIVNALILGLLCNAHVLVEGVPGIAKTLAIRTLAKVSGCTVKRVQFTVDMLPTDITGITTYTPDKGFEVLKGPIFANFVIADEINRSPPKTQSALIEAMQERQVTIGKKRFLLPNPFFVMATENPIENSGVYPLPEAQIDRFLFKLIMGYPEEEEEMRVLETNMTLKKFDAFDIKAVITPKEILTMQEIAKKVYVDDSIKAYILKIVRKTRTKEFQSAEYVTYGSSPRASIGLFIASKAQALMQGRNYVIPEDVKEVVYSVMRHRLILSYKAVIQKISPDAVIKDILDSITVE